MFKVQTMYYVVTRKLGESMRGSKAACKSRNNATPRGTIYGIFESPERAQAYCEKRWGDACGLMIGNTILIIAQ